MNNFVILFQNPIRNTFFNKKDPVTIQKCSTQIVNIIFLNETPFFSVQNKILKVRNQTPYTRISTL